MTDTADIKPVVSLAEVAVADWQHGAKFSARIGSFGKLLGLEKLGCMLTVVPPGKIAFPYHVHHANDEMFVILQGSGEYRFGDKTYPVRAGDVVSAPAGGPERAHQIINTGSEEMRYLGISTTLWPEAIEYPESNKFAVASRPHPSGDRAKLGLRFIGRREMSINYWDGE
ncbi:MAG TPA: cupin domain-containing protein [Xanthobacteraceae bacterium]|nr:cupin domain-containing protein [Xanthobacteraceae bacterium]